jgi:uncharacterized protein YcbK (DUF882 family)
MRISRRRFLRISAGMAASVASLSVTGRAFAAPALVGLKELNIRTLSFDSYYTGERVKPIDYWIEGKYIPDALNEIDFALRDWRADEVLPIEPKLLDLLYHLGHKLETDCRYELISGYRSPSTNAMLHEADAGVATDSLHLKGWAVDVSLPERELKDVHAAALALKLGGVGYYPDADFVHLDVGRVRRWVDYG